MPVQAVPLRLPDRPRRATARSSALARAPLLAVAAAVACGGAAPDGGDRTVDPDLLRDHTRALAHDSLAGRGTATPGERSAARYIADRLRELELAPLSRASAGSARASRVDAEGESPDLRLPVPLIAYPSDSASASLSILREGERRVLRAPDFYHPGGGPGAFANFEGELLLAGPTPGALEALEGHGDLTGTVVVLGPPWTGLPEVEAELLRRGAAGTLQAVPGAFYDRLRVVRGPLRFSLAKETGDPAPPAAVIGPAALEALGLTGEVHPPPASGDPSAVEAARPLGMRVEVAFGMTPEPRTAHNVAAILPGADPEVADEYVLFMAHYDHVGSGQPAAGDSVWNGFVDNAAGVAILLELARVLAAEPPDRSAVFLFTTAEEQGLLGATAFVDDPPIPLDRIRAAINIDGGAPPADVGGWTIAAPEGSGLRKLAADALRDAGWMVEERPVISDSDHWAFLRAGVPALFLYPGEQAPDTHPHTPDDEWRADFPFEGMATYAEAALLVGRSAGTREAGRAGAASAGRAPASSGPPASSPSLDYGPHDVGFTVFEGLDSTRAFRPRHDFRGEPAEETARPVQVSVWYPARSDGGAPPMRAGEFRLLRETEVDFGRELDAWERERLRAEFLASAVGFGTDSVQAAHVWDEATPAVREAPPLAGPHPTVLYFTAAGISNPLLPAYLASHGFVVASFPSNGRMTEGTLEFTPNALTLDTDLDDAGFVHALLRRLPYADATRLAVTSFSGGSLAALLWQMRDMQASALVAIEGWERYRRGADIIEGSIHYEPHRVRVPFLMIERAADETSPQYAKVPDVVGALPYADITRAAFRDAAHGDFLSHVSFGHTAHQPGIFETTARMVRLFLQATLEGDAEAARALAELAPPPDDPFFSVSRDPAIGPVPTEEELYRLAETDPAAAADAYEEATRVVPGSDLFRESVLTRAAIFAPTAEARAAILEIVVDAYPASTEAWFRLGGARAEAGRPEGAAAAFRTALTVVEEDPGLDPAQREEWRDRIRAALEDPGGG